MILPIVVKNVDFKIREIWVRILDLSHFIHMSKGKFHIPSSFLTYKIENNDIVMIMIMCD